MPMWQEYSTVHKRLDPRSLRHQMKHSTMQGNIKFHEMKKKIIIKRKKQKQEKR